MTDTSRLAVDRYHSRCDDRADHVRPERELE